MREVTQSELENCLRDLDIYGFTTIKNAISKQKIDDLLQRVENGYSQIKNHKDIGLSARDANDKMVYNLQNKDIEFINILDYQPVKEILIRKLNDKYYRFIDEEHPNYILNYYNARSSGSYLPLHIDSHIPSPGSHTWAMQVVFLLEDMDQDNGCTTVVPGSHLSGMYTDRDLTNLKYINASAGDIVIWDSRLWHGTAENVSHTSRWALIATFTRWWLKQTMDITRSLPNEIYKNLSDEQKLLLGFCSIPPSDQSQRINTKTSYSELLDNVEDYYK